jgi:hypothetical protein
MMPPVRRSLAVLIAALLTGLLAVAGVSAPANAAPQGSLKIVSITNSDKPTLGDLLEAGEKFDVVVQVLDNAGQPMTVSRVTTIKLSADGPGTLGGTTTAVIPRNGSSATISGATYSPSANGVVLSVSVSSGVDLLPAPGVTVDVAVTAVRDTARPNVSFELKDQDCTAPTEPVPTCGQLILPKGADGGVTLWVGSCDNLGAPPPGESSLACRSEGGTRALVVTAIARLKESSAPDAKSLYSNTAPATLIIACDKALCRATANGVPKLPVIYTLNNDGPLTETAGPCPSKGTIAPGDKACVDYVSSSRSQGDLYLHLLFNIDMRGSLRA